MNCLICNASLKTSSIKTPAQINSNVDTSYMYRLCVFPQVRDQLNSNKPSEVQIHVEEVQNPCRLVLKPPHPRGLTSDPTLSSRAQQAPKGLLMLAMCLLLSSLFMTE